jgi:predicted acetyltransferase
MIVEIAEKDIAGKARTRKLYEEAFDDPKEFVDYYYEDVCGKNRMVVSIEGGKGSESGDGGEVVSMLHLNPYSVNLCGTVVQSYYVVAVATTALRRHEGQMRRVFDRTFEILAKEKVPFVFLMPVDEAIYSWMGFETICDFAVNRIADYEQIRERYDVYCVRDEDYIRRMRKEDEFRAMDKGEVLPEEPVIMAKITDLEAFGEAAGRRFESEGEAIEWLKRKKVYFCEEV